MDDLTDTPNVVEDEKKANEARELEQMAIELERHDLVEMTKGDETLFVHPTTVAEHKALGWSRV